MIVHWQAYINQKISAFTMSFFRKCPCPASSIDGSDLLVYFKDVYAVGQDTGTCVLMQEGTGAKLMFANYIITDWPH